MAELISQLEEKQGEITRLYEDGRAAEEDKRQKIRQIDVLKDRAASMADKQGLLEEKLEALSRELAVKAEEVKAV